MQMQKIDKLFLDIDAQAEPIRVFLDERTRSPGRSMPRLSGDGRLFIHVVPIDTFGRHSVIPLTSCAKITLNGYLAQRFSTKK